MRDWIEPKLKTLKRLAIEDEKPLHATLTRGLFAPTFSNDIIVELWNEIHDPWVRIGSDNPQYPIPTPALHDFTSRVLDWAMTQWQRERPAQWLKEGIDVHAFENRDGLPLLGGYRGTEGCFSFESWSPEDGSDQGRWFLALRRLALNCQPPKPIMQDLLELGQYLINKGFEDLKGSPRWIRIWSLKADTLPMIQTIIPYKKTGEPWLLDLRGLRHVQYSDALHDTTIKLGARPGSVHWWLTRDLQQSRSMSSTSLLSAIVRSGGLILLGDGDAKST